MYINGMNMSYDYTNLIADMKFDIEQGKLRPEQIITIDRKENPLSGTNYKPIINYDLGVNGDKEVASVSAILTEMEEWNNIL